MSLLPQGGLNIAGHKIPWEAVGALAAVAGVVVVLRARSSSQNVVQAGVPPVDTSSLSGPPIFGQDQSAALSQISAQLSTLGQQLNQAQATTVNQSLTSPANAPASIDPNKVIPPSFSDWLSGAFTGTRPDLAQAVSQNRWADLQGEYAKELSAWEAAELAAGKHF